MAVPRCLQRRALFLLIACIASIAFLLFGISLLPENFRWIDLEVVSLRQNTYGNVGVQTELFGAKKSGRDLLTNDELTLEQRCVKEVLHRLGMPLRLDHYVLTQPPPRPLKLAQLSAVCRKYLTPKPVSALRRKQLACFLPKPWFDSFGPNDKPRIEGALRLIASAFRKADVPLYLDGGTALGSWRMQGHIPYDSDVDFMLLERHQERAMTVCEKLMATFPELIKFYEHGYRFWRLDLLRPNKTRLFQIDVFLFHLKEKQQIAEFVLHPHKVNVSRLLPFVMRPFQGTLFLSWRNMPEFIKQLYGAAAVHWCAPCTWITIHHKIRCPTRSVKCDELNYYFNFVRRWIHPNGQLVEVLFNRSSVLGVFHAPES